MSNSEELFAAARAAWEDRHGARFVDRDRWYRAFLAVSVLLVCAIGFAVWAAVRTEYVPYIVAVDELGRTQPVIAPREISNWPDAAVRHEVSDFIHDWRSVSSDRNVVIGRLGRIQYFIDNGSTAHRKILDYSRAPTTNPQIRSANETVEVEVHSVVAFGGRTWLAEWTETVRARAGGQITRTLRYQGTFVLGQRRITDEGLLRRNPFGMVIEDVDVVRLDG